MNSSKLFIRSPHTDLVIDLLNALTEDEIHELRRHVPRPSGKLRCTFWHDVKPRAG